MDFHLSDWANLLLRWTHLLAGISWIGSSFYFMWLDSHLTVPEQTKSDVEGELFDAQVPSTVLGEIVVEPRDVGGEISLARPPGQVEDALCRLLLEGRAPGFRRKTVEEIEALEPEGGMRSRIGFVGARDERLA